MYNNKWKIVDYDSLSRGQIKKISIKIPNLPFQQVDWREVLKPAQPFNNSNKK